jgi:hypothetical protein
MAKKDTGTAFVVVQRAWYDHTMMGLAGGSSNSQLDAHVIMARLDDTNDPHGVWVRGLESRFHRKSNDSRVVMSLLIPWRFIYGIGMADVPVKTPAGFANTTVFVTEK